MPPCHLISYGELSLGGKGYLSYLQDTAWEFVTPLELVCLSVPLVLKGLYPLEERLAKGYCLLPLLVGAECDIFYVEGLLNLQHLFGRHSCPDFELFAGLAIHQGLVYLLLQGMEHGRKLTGYFFTIMVLQPVYFLIYALSFFFGEIGLA